LHWSAVDVRQRDSGGKGVDRTELNAYGRDDAAQPVALF
jgi:hypothetical protein